MEGKFVYSIIIGALSGILGGAFGLGGSFVMLPLLLLFQISKDFSSAIGTVLLSLLPPVSLLAVFEYAKRKKIDYWVGTILFISYFIFAYVGSLINKMYSEKLLLFLCGILFIIIGIYFILHSYTKI